MEHHFSMECQLGILTILKLPYVFGLWAYGNQTASTTNELQDGWL
jgi:hypothetical protein